ncbi:MAG TPA: biopolymer transporter ExbD [Thermoanaerobaculia bacterium]|nr:biopolymer transporter ExbD [Thermoanaerobaculia bacterium]
MGMNVSGGSALKSEINVTPLVDVVLVLLIIFMVVIPILQMGYPVNTPPENKTAQFVPPSADQLIVRMDAGGRYYLNKEEVPLAQFPARLKQVAQNRGKKMVFFAADGELLYGEVAAFMDMVRNNGVENLGIVFDDIRPVGP